MVLKTEKDTSDRGVEEAEADLFDNESVEFHNKDFQDTAATLTLNDTITDKITFTVFAANIFATPFFVASYPQYFYIWHTIKAVILISYRWYNYKKQGLHYLFFDFCYFFNFLLLVYIWVPSSVLGASLRGAIFTTVFSLGCGPVIAAVPWLKMSLVLHSTDKMTYLFTHMSPAVAVISIRHVIVGLDYPLCASPTEPGLQGCSHVGWTEIVFYPMIFYLMWLAFYIVVVEILLSKRVERKQRPTLYTLVVEKKKNKGFFYKYTNLFGPKYRKAMFHVYGTVFTLGLSIVSSYFCYHYFYAAAFLLCLITTVSCWNGASFYIDVFSQRYYNQKLLKSKSH